jgi:hypothetical protein
MVMLCPPSWGEREFPSLLTQSVYIKNPPGVLKVSVPDGPFLFWLFHIK